MRPKCQPYLKRLLHVKQKYQNNNDLNSLNHVIESICAMKGEKILIKILTERKTYKIMLINLPPNLT